MRAVSTALLIFAAACGDDGNRATPDAASPDAPSGQSVSIAFAAEVNGMPWHCGTQYANVGTPAASYTATDFRAYLYDISLLDAAGAATPVTLDQDGAFQRANLALLDFETGEGACEMGTAATHTTITGTIAPGAYAGVRFTVGVPDAMNYLDASTAAPPLSDTTLWWVWLVGYKFIKADGIGGASNPFNLHVGSTGCPGGSPTDPPSGPCTAPNISTVTLTGWSADKTIVADIGKVLAGVDITRNTADTAPGCMSEDQDPECIAVFPKLGLPIGTTAAGPQQLFNVR